MKLQVRAHHDHGAPGIIDAFAQQVLPEAPLLALQRVAERLQRPVVGSPQGAAAAPVVEQGVHRLLQHPLFVANDHFRSLQLHELFQAVVAVDNPAVKVIQIAGGETPAVQLDDRP